MYLGISIDRCLTYIKKLKKTTRKDRNKNNIKHIFENIFLAPAYSITEYSSLVEQRYYDNARYPAKLNYETDWEPSNGHLFHDFQCSLKYFCSISKDELLRRESRRNVKLITSYQNTKNLTIPS